MRSANATKGLDSAVNDLRGFLAENREGSGHHRRPTQRDHHRPERQPWRRQADTPHHADGVPEFHQHLPARTERGDRILAPVNFANTVQFICSAIQAASSKGYEQSAKLCVQYLAPIIKNRQYNFLPIGRQPVRRSVGAPERDHLQRGPAATRTCRLPGAPTRHRTAEAGPLPAEAPLPADPPPEAAPTDPGLGLQGLMVPLPINRRHRRRCRGHPVMRLVTAALAVACLSACSGMREWRGLNSLSAARHRRQRRRLLRHPGANARCGRHSAEHPGPRRRRQRRQRHQDRGAGLARTGDHAHQRRCPSTREQHRQGRARPACWGPCTSSWRRPPTSRRRVNSRMAR